EAIRIRVKATIGPHHDDHMQWVRDLYAELLPSQSFVQRTQEGTRGNAIRDLGILLVEPDRVIPPRAARVPDEGGGLLPMLPASALRRAYRFYKKNGVRNTIVRILQEVMRRVGSQS